MPEPAVVWSWSPNSPDRPVRSVRYRGDVLLVESGDDQLLALDPATGGVRWSRTLPAATLAVGGTTDVVAVLDRNRDLRGLDLRDGAELWRHAAVIGPGRPVEDGRQSVTYSVGTAAEDGRLFTVQREWTRTFDGIEYGSIERRYDLAVLDAAGRIHDRRADVASYDGTWTLPAPEFGPGLRWIVAYSPDGTVRWRSRSWRHAGEAVIRVDREAGLVIGVSDGGLRAFDAGTGELRWSAPPVRSRSGVDLKGYVYGAVLAGPVLCVHVAGTLAAFRVGTGEPLWRYDVDEHVQGLRADSQAVYVLQRFDRDLVAISAADGSAIWRYGDRVRRTLVAARDGLVHVADSKGIVALEAALPGHRRSSATTTTPAGARPDLSLRRIGLQLPDLSLRRIRHPLLSALEDAHRRHGSGDGSFCVTGVGGRRIAVAEYGSRFYDEGIPVYFAVDLRTGAFQDWHANGVEGRSAPPLAQAFLVPPWDPVRRWLSADPAGPPAPVRIRTRGQLARFSAAAIARADHPELAAEPQLTLPGNLRRLFDDQPPESLPYKVLFGSQTLAPSHIGRQ